MRVVTEAERRVEQVAGLINRLPFLGHREAPKPVPSFAERWQAAESFSPKQQATFAVEEIQALIQKINEGKIPHAQTKIPLIPGWAVGGRVKVGDKSVTRINIGDIPEGSLPVAMRTPLLAHLSARKENPQPWGGEPSLGLSFCIARGLVTLASIELTVDTINTDGLIWVEEHRQGIQAEVDTSAVMFGDHPFITRVIKDDWGWPQTNQSHAFHELERYADSNYSFQFQTMRVLAQFAESTIQAKQPPPAK